MKKWLCAASLGLALAASASVQAADKIAIVNVSSIFQQLPAREAVAKQLENEFKGRATELQGMGAICRLKCRSYNVMVLP